MSQLISYSSYVIFNDAQSMYHPVGINWAQSSRDERLQQCIWLPTGVGDGGWGVGGYKVHCPLGCSTKHFFIAMRLENVNGFSDCLNMEMQVFK